MKNENKGAPTKDTMLLSILIVAYVMYLIGKAMGTTLYGPYSVQEAFLMNFNPVTLVIIGAITLVLIGRVRSNRNKQ